MYQNTGSDLSLDKKIIPVFRPLKLTQVRVTNVNKPFSDLSLANPGPGQNTINNPTLTRAVTPDKIEL